MYSITFHVNAILHEVPKLSSLYKENKTNNPLCQMDPNFTINVPKNALAKEVSCLNIQMNRGTLYRFTGLISYLGHVDVNIVLMKYIEHRGLK